MGGVVKDRKRSGEKREKEGKKDFKRKNAVLVSSACPQLLCGVGSGWCMGMGQEE